MSFVHALTKSLALEFAADKIRVNAQLGRMANDDAGWIITGAILPLLMEG